MRSDVSGGKVWMEVGVGKGSGLRINVGAWLGEGGVEDA